jgi:hypothetical protein
VTPRVVRVRNRLHLTEPVFRIAERLADHYGVTVDMVIEALLIHCAEQVLDADPRDLPDGAAGLEMAQPPVDAAPAQRSAPRVSRRPGATDQPRHAGGGRVISLAERRRRTQDNAIPAGSRELTAIDEMLLARSKAVRQRAQRLCERAETVRQNTLQLCSWLRDLRIESL